MLMSNDHRKDQLVEMFASIAKNTKWDLRKPLLWGYFFTNGSRAPLDNAAPILAAQGYRFVDIHLGDKDAPSEPDVWWLHVEKIEIHAVESLDARNQELDAFARANGIESYDGWDVGPVSASH